MNNSETIQPPKRQSRSNFVRTSRELTKKVIPRSWVLEWRRYRRFSKLERRLYLKVRVANIFRGREHFLVPRTARSLVFVCFGNIMRSPMSEAMLRRAITEAQSLNSPAKFEIVSAGLNATEGNRAHPWAISGAREFGLSLEGHRSLRLTQSMIDRADAIMAMDYQNVVELLSRYPAAAHKVFLFGVYASGQSRPIEIRDPFFGNEQGTVECYRLIEICARNLADALLGQQMPGKEGLVNRGLEGVPR